MNNAEDFNFKRRIAEIYPKTNETEEDIIREVAEEENMSYEEVKEIWDTFKSVKSKGLANKTKTNKSKTKKKRKAVKKSRKNNR